MIHHQLQRILHGLQDTFGQLRGNGPAPEAVNEFLLPEKAYARLGDMGIRHFQVGKFSAHFRRRRTIRQTIA